MVLLAALLQLQRLPVLISISPLAGLSNETLTSFNVFALASVVIDTVGPIRRMSQISSNAS